jgi:S1-C subfamily serine protease
MTNRLALIVLLAATAAALTACKSEPPPPAPANAPNPPPPPRPTPLPPPPSPGKSVAATNTDEPITRDSARIQFGIAPGDYDDPAKGVLVGDVIPGTSAADAGIKENDRLMTWNGTEIKDVRDWMRLMSVHKPGDVVEVGVLREGKTIPVRVTLKARKD